jgi:aryl-alcohol dehydrogenase-like predicted oxidoreductase
VHPVAVVESEYSLWERHVEAEILPQARQLGTGLIAHSPLGKGFLAGELTSSGQFGPGDHRRHHPRLQGDNLLHNRVLVEEAATVAAACGLTTSQVALAWLLGRGPDIVPIPGSRRLEHIAENLAAVDVRLAPDVVERLTAIFAPERVSGSRHPAHRAAAGVARDG